MFDQREDPDDLLASLESFVRIWHGEPRCWYGIDPTKLADSHLPDPLRRLYAFAGHWPGNNFWSSAFAHQDCLVPFEFLAARDGQLVFAWENQCVWMCGTSSEGADPPVWVSFDQGAWKPLCDSLAQFLVTLCLQETLFGCSHLASGREVLSGMKATGKHVSPVWLNGPFVSLSNEGFKPRSFHLVDGRILVMDDHWCGTNSKEATSALPELFKPPSEPAPEFRTEKPLWENPAIPMAIRKGRLDSLARQHEEQAEFHAKRAASYRRIGDSITG